MVRTSPGNTLDSIEQRLRVLEGDLQRSRRANRILLFAVVTMVCVAGAQVATPQTSKPAMPKEAMPKDAIPKATLSKDASSDGAGDSLAPDRRRSIEAEQIVLVDRVGRSRITMSITDSGPEIGMLDENGKQRLRFGCSAVSSGLYLLDSDQSPLLSLRLHHGEGRADLEIRSPQGSSLTKADGLSIRDAADRGHLQLALLNGNFPVLGIGQSDQAGPPSIEMTAGEGARSLKIHDDNGHALFSVSADNSGSTRIAMRHPDHERSLQLSAGPKEFDGPSIAFVGPAKADGSGGLLPRLQFGLHPTRQPYLRMVDDDGRTRFSAP